jgi:superkiller protein 3
VTCLKYNHNYAPAYTSLGIFYADIVGDGDRAYKCFQKAFELDAGETEAAERLARDFADSGQWELVEVVARRVLEASRKRLSRKRELSWPHRALGVAELVCQPEIPSNLRINASILELFNHSKLLSEIPRTMFIRGLG